MNSAALTAWLTDAHDALDELRGAHQAIGGTAPGRRTETQQLNYSYVLLLSARFQAYCRDLHSEAMTAVLDGAPSSLTALIAGGLTRDRALDRGNPNPSNIGSDFNRFGFVFWDAVNNAAKRNHRRQQKLIQLNDWRNAISHHEIARKRAQLSPDRITLAVCRNWHSALNGLAKSIDTVMAHQVEVLVGTRPW